MDITMAATELAELVADDFTEFEPRFVKEVVRLLENDNTIPFIARYRRVQTGGMDADQLRDLKAAYDNLKLVRVKAAKIIEKNQDAIPNSVKQAIQQARTVEEVNDLYAPFKKGGKGTLAERARAHGLEAPTQELFANPARVINLEKFVNSAVEGLQTVKDIEMGIQHILADLVSKDEETNAMVKKSIVSQIWIESKTTPTKKKADKEKKFEHYYDFSMNTDRVKPHQILAINRGDEQKILTVKMFMGEQAKNKIMTWLNRKWIPHHGADNNKALLAAATDDAFKRLIERKYLKRARFYKEFSEKLPLDNPSKTCISRRVKLTSKAEREAVEVFSNNLKRLLLAPPVRGKNILGIDPGFSHGCKLAALDKHGQLLDSGVIYPFGNASKGAEQKIIGLVAKHRCEMIAIGNGTACRETESFIDNMIKRKSFKTFDISYCIVNESGASIWSVTKEATLEFPDLDPNLRSAVSIGRRLQDPLLELVKIEPKHIGVGMYQHDVSEVLLKGALEGVLEDCVSFVGVDLNACSAAVLRRIAGLGAKKAEAIIEWRDKNGPFINRRQLMSVKGLGQKCFEQCAGFVRVVANETHLGEGSSTEVKAEPQATTRKRKAESKPKSVSKKRKLEDNLLPEPLDRTMIHPESYEMTYKLLEFIGANAKMIGTKEIMQLIDTSMKTRLTDLKETLKIDDETLSLVIKGLKQPLEYDLRTEVEQPSFKKELRSIDDISVGQTVTGVVNNVTPFGVFVDFGVKKDGLIHQSNLSGCKDLGPGDKLECCLIKIEKERQRYGLKFKRKLNVVPVLM